MRARVPLDVDLEDRIVYGLTPIRLAYVVLAGLAALALWESHVGIAWLRASLATIVLAAGVVAAWGRWRGRAADAWLVDFALFILSTRRLKWERGPSPAPPPHEESLAP
jgi:hypothetical protein